MTVNVQYEFLPMTGFEPQTSGIEATALPTELPPLPFRKQCYELLTVVIFDSWVVPTDLKITRLWVIGELR